MSKQSIIGKRVRVHDSRTVTSITHKNEVGTVVRSAVGDYHIVAFANGDEHLYPRERLRLVKATADHGAAA